MRIAIVAESFPPDVNGVAHSALRVAQHLVMHGHSPLVIAPRPAPDAPGGTGSFPCPVLRLPSLPLPGYRGFRIGIGVPTRRLRSMLIRHGTELVHLASPFVLGSSAATAARRLRLPSVAVYQTDVPAYARVYGLGRLGEAVAWRWLRRIHNGASRTLAPSWASAASLREHGIRRVGLWGRGVDSERFSPARRSPRLRCELAPGGQVLVGYVGRLAQEKRVDLLHQVAALPGVRLIIVGCGPAEDALRQALPGAVFLGGLRAAGVPAALVVAGDGPLRGRLERRAASAGLPVHFPGFLPRPAAVATLLATADVVIAPGLVETFGLAALEALACGTPVVVSGSSALPEVTGTAGVTVTGEDFAAGVLSVLRRPAAQRRAAARARAGQFGWPAAVRGFLAAHALAAETGTRGQSPPAHRQRGRTRTPMERRQHDDLRGAR